MKDQYGSRVLRLYFIRAIYCTAGFVCKVLIYANYARHCGLTDFNSTVTLIPSF